MKEDEMKTLAVVGAFLMFNGSAPDGNELLLVKTLGVSVVVDKGVVGPELFDPADLLLAKIEDAIDMNMVDLNYDDTSFNRLYEGIGIADLCAKISSKVKLDAILVGKLNYKFRQNSLYRSRSACTIVCDLGFSYKILSPKGEVLERDVLLESATGLGQSGALSAAIECVADTIASKFRGPPRSVHPAYPK